MLNLFVIGFGRPDLLRLQNSLFRKYLTDEHQLILVDNTLPLEAESMRATAEMIGVEYIRSHTVREHPYALNFAARIAAEREYEYYGMLDHDVFPRSPSSLIEKIDKSGFYGIGQRHSPTQTRYLFPGFCFFSREWVNGRELNFNGIRGVDKRDDGDCGSMLNSLFTDEDFKKMHRGEHGYGTIRPEDGFGLQSWGYEVFDGTFVHFMNASRWMAVPDIEDRERLLNEMLENL